MRLTACSVMICALCVWACGGTQDARSRSGTGSGGEGSAGEEFRCKARRAEESGARQTRVLDAYGIWAKNMLGLTRQFHATPWATIPPSGQADVRARFDAHNDAQRAELAAQRGVPVEEIELGCKPEFPRCMDLGDATNQGAVAHWYGQIVLDALVAFDRLVSEKKSTEFRVVEVIMAADGGRSATRPVARLDALMSEARANEEELRKAHAKVLQLLPKGATIAELRLPLPARGPDCAPSSAR